MQYILIHFLTHTYSFENLVFPNIFDL